MGEDGRGEGGGVFIEYMPLGELLTRRHQGNPKLHAVDELGASMSRFGWVGSVLLDDETAGGTGTLVAGHGRLKTLNRRKQEGSRDLSAHHNGYSKTGKTF